MTSVLFVGPLDRVLFLRTLPMLDGLSPGHLAAIAQHCRECSMARGTALNEPGQISDAIHFIVEGEIEVRRADGQTELLGPGDVVGFLELLGRSATDVQVQTTGETVTLELDRDALLAVCEAHFAVVMRFTRYLASRIISGQHIRPLPERRETVPFPAIGGNEVLGFVDSFMILIRSGAFSIQCFDALAELVQHVTQVQWQSGAAIWKVDDPADYFLLLISGELRAQPKQGPVLTFCAGSTPGMYESLLQETRWHKTTCVVPTVALRIDIEPFVDILEDHFDLALDFLAILARRLRSMDSPD